MMIVTLRQHQQQNRKFKSQKFFEKLVHILGTCTYPSASLRNMKVRVFDYKRWTAMMLQQAYKCNNTTNMHVQVKWTSELFWDYKKIYNTDAKTTKLMTMIIHVDRVLLWINEFKDIVKYDQR
jgi:hypothetical protein